MGMGTRSEAAILRRLEHFREIKGDLLFLQVHKAEAAKARSVDDEAFGSLARLGMTGS